MQLQRQQIFLIAGIVLALVSIFLIKIYLDQQKLASEREAAERFKKLQASQTAILIAKKDIPRGKEIEPEYFDVKVVPNQFVQPGAVTSADRIAGMIAISTIYKGEQITLSKLSNITRRTEGLSSITPEGKRAITLAVDNISALAGMIKAGDHVDVIAVMPIPMKTSENKIETDVKVFPLFQDISVLAVGQETLTPDEEAVARYKKEITKKETISPVITVALTPQQASLVAFVQEHGKIRLTLRSAQDSTLEPVKAADWNTLLQYVFPQPPEEEHKPSDYVEIYRGMNKEKVLLSK